MGLVATAVLIWGLGIGGSGQWERHITAHYARGRMERTVKVRRAQGYDLPAASCYIASPSIPIGAQVQVKGLNTGATLLCYVADTSAPKDRYRHIHARDRKGHEIGQIEVGFEEALTLCGSTKLRNDECETLTRVLGK